jgi:hypothetical protein
MSNVGELIDKVAAADMELHKIELVVKELKKKRALSEAKLMRALEKQHINKASGRLAHAILSSRRHASIKDMAKFNKYVKANDAFDLYQRRINAKAYFDRLAEKQSVPGVEVYEHQFVKVTLKRG